jgi:hypothetical protein
MHLSESVLEWVVSNYLLTLADLLLAGSRLADTYGRSRLFVIPAPAVPLSRSVANPYTFS